MDSEVVKVFNAELVSLYELRPPVSKKKIVDITKAALKAIKYYKHVVFCVEKFLTKCKPEYKIPGLYCIDSIIRQSRHQFKDKDVFAPRFASNMHVTLANLLCCKAEEQLKVVRVLNLWKSHGIYDEGRVSPWLAYCRSLGLEIEYERVERCVKGEQADMSIYRRPQDKKRVEPKTPPLKEDVGAAHDVLSCEPSDECVAGGVSEKEALAMLTSMGLDRGGIFRLDHGLLQKVHKLVNNKLTEKRESDSKSRGNIKTLLSQQFDYSDEEMSDDEYSRKSQGDTKPSELTKQQIIGMAEAVLREVGTKEEIQRMHSERLTALNQASACVQAIKHSMPSAPTAANPLSNRTLTTPINIPLNAAPDQTVLHMSSIPVPPPMIEKKIIPSAVAQTRQVRTHIPSMRVTNYPSNLSRDHQDTSYRSNSRDLDDRFQMGSSLCNQGRLNQYEGRQGRSNDRSRDRSNDNIRAYGDGRSSVRGHSNRDDNYHDFSRDRRNGGDTAKDSMYNREKDRDTYREIGRQRRKMGLPWPAREGHTLIASCTLWFGRIPLNCTEEDIRLSVVEAGEPSRISIIHSRACAYVTMKDRKAAFRIMDRTHGNIQVSKKSVRLNWGIGQGLKSDKYSSYWDPDSGYSLIPFSELPDNLESLLEGGYLDVETLPPQLAGLYDEHGLKSRKTDSSAPVSLASGGEMQMSTGLSCYPFSLNQPPALRGTPQFFPPVMPVSAPFSSLPVVDNRSLPTREGGKVSIPVPSTSVDPSLQKAQVTTHVGSSSNQRMRLPCYDHIRAPGSNSFMPNNCTSQFPSPYPNNRSGITRAFGVRGVRPGGGLSKGNQSRPPFPPNSNYPGMHIRHPGFFPFNAPVLQPSRIHNRSSSFNQTITSDRRGGLLSDDSVNESVTSTTHEEDVSSDCKSAADTVACSDKLSDSKL